MLDHVITKPGTVAPYQAHQMVKGLTKGSAALFADVGEALLIRSSEPITEQGKAIRECQAGEVVGFELRACVSKKRKGRHIYPPQADWKTRHAWLDRQGTLHGFEVLTVTCRAEQMELDDGRERKFKVDQTDFVGVLRVTDSEKFKSALIKGIGSTARTFGFGMLVI